MFPICELYEIAVAGRLNRCWMRFAILKELCQIVAFEENIFEPDHDDAVQQLQRAANVKRFLGHPDRVNQFLNSEDYCYLMAMELIIPRRKKTAIIDLLASSPTWDAADQIKAPEKIIEAYFAKHNGLSISSISDSLKENASAPPIF